MPSPSANSDATETTASAEPFDGTGNIGPYSWQVLHDGAVFEGGEVGPGEEHPWTGDSSAHPAYAIANTLFEWACETALEQCRDAIVEARVEGRPEPAPVRALTVRLCDGSGVEVVSMTTRLLYRAITEDDLDEFRDLMAAYAQEAQELEARRRRGEPPPRSPFEWPVLHDDPIETGGSGAAGVRSDRRDEIARAPAEPRPPDTPTPHQRLINELREEAHELRDSVQNPEDVRHNLFRAEQRLTDAQTAEREVATTSDDTALIVAADRVARYARRVTYWHTRLADSTETYLQAAALTTEAAYRERELPTP